MPADFGLVAHASERDADELPAERLRDRTRQRRLSDAGRADETENRTLDVGVQLPDREVFEDAVLSLLESGMVGIQHVLGLWEINDLVGPFRPGQGHQPVEICARHRVLGGSDGHLRQTIELAQRLLLHQLGHASGLDLLQELLRLLGLIVALAELLLNRLHLLAEEVLALVLPDFGLHLRLNFRSELQYFQLLDEDAIQIVHPRADVERFEHFLLDGGRNRRQRRGNEVGEPSRLGDVHRERLQIVREERRQRHDLLEVRLDVPRQRVDFEPVGVLEILVRGADPRTQVRLGGDNLLELQPGQTLDDQAEASIGKLEHLVNVRGGADGVQIVLPRLFDGGVTLGEHRDQLAVPNRIVDEPDGALAGHGERHERIREEDGISKRQNRQFRGNRQRPIADRHVLGLEVFDLIAHGDLTSISDCRLLIADWIVDC